MRRESRRGRFRFFSWATGHFRHSCRILIEWPSCARGPGGFGGCGPDVRCRDGILRETGHWGMPAAYCLLPTALAATASSTAERPLRSAKRSQCGTSMCFGSNTLSPMMGGIARANEAKLGGGAFARTAWLWKVVGGGPGTTCGLRVHSDREDREKKRRQNEADANRHKILFVMDLRCVLGNLASTIEPKSKPIYPTYEILRSSLGGESGSRRSGQARHTGRNTDMGKNAADEANPGWHKPFVGRRFPRAIGELGSTNEPNSSIGPRDSLSVIGRSRRAVSRRRSEGNRPRRGWPGDGK